MVCLSQPSVQDTQSALRMQILLLLLVCARGALARRGNGSTVYGGGTGHGIHDAERSASHLGLSEQREVAASPSWDLRVCNAYAFESGLETFHSPQPAISAKLPRPEPAKLTRDGPVPYKWCADLGRVEGLGRGSLLSFRLGSGLPVGGFRVTALPVGGSTLQLVVYRYDAASTAAAFTAHVFGSGDDPEVAVVDAYQGDSHSELKVRSPNSPWQTLHFGKAVSLKPGWYEWSLSGDNQQTFRGGGTVGFHMSSQGRYTAIRVGVDAQRGPSFEEELVLFPTSWFTVHSFAGRGSGARLLALLLAFGVLFLFQ